MGMYDNIRCKAPLPGTPPHFINSETLFQTKNLECLLYTYEITADDKLMLVEDFDGEEPLPKAEIISNFDDNLIFYTSNMRACDGKNTYTDDGSDYVFIEYRAKFENGHLFKISEISRVSKPALHIDLYYKFKKQT